MSNSLKIKNQEGTNVAVLILKKHEKNNLNDCGSCFYGK